MWDEYEYEDFDCYKDNYDGNDEELVWSDYGYSDIGGSGWDSMASDCFNDAYFG